MPAATKLDAVNEMLLAIGQAPVNTLAVAGIRDVSVASMTLDNVSREIQTPGHSFNTFTITPTRTADGHIIIADDVLFIDPVDPTISAIPRVDPNDNLNKLYDLARDSFEWERDVTVTVVRHLPFEHLPQHARRYITAFAKQRFQAATVGSDTLDRQISKDLGAAYADFRRVELLQRDNNILRSGATSISRGRFRNRRVY